MARRKDVSKMTKREFRDHLLHGRKKIIREWEQCNRDAAYYNEHVLPKYPGAEPMPVVAMPGWMQRNLDAVVAQLIVMDAELGIEHD